LLTSLKYLFFALCGFFVRGEERFQKERMSTAYQFFEVAKKVVVLKPKCWLKKAKPPFEATGYQMYYVRRCGIADP
jgi:hypothetical protein